MTALYMSPILVASVSHVLNIVTKPFPWSWGQAKPIINQFSWTNLSSVLWVEQPVGTGSSQGTPNIENEDQLTEQLVGFMQPFLDVFSELKGTRFWPTGKSMSVLSFVRGWATQGYWFG